MFELENMQWQAQEEKRAAAAASEEFEEQLRREAEGRALEVGLARRLEEQERVFALRDQQALLALAAAEKLGEAVRPRPNSTWLTDPTGAFFGNDGNDVDDDDDSGEDGSGGEGGTFGSDLDDEAFSELDEEEAAEQAAQDEAQRWIQEQLAKGADGEDEDDMDTARRREEAQSWIEEQRRAGEEALQRQVSLLLSPTSHVFLFLIFFSVSTRFAVSVCDFM
jgi:hypothetical protein